MLVRCGGDDHVPVQAAGPAALLRCVLRHGRAHAGSDSAVAASPSTAASAPTVADAAAAASAYSPFASAATAIAPTPAARVVRRNPTVERVH